MSKIKPPSAKRRPTAVNETATIDKLSALITAQQAHFDRLRDEVDTLRQTNKGLVALLRTAVCDSCIDGFYDAVDMETGEVSKRPCPVCS